jgi:type VI secretion system protein ImpC
VAIQDQLPKSRITLTYRTTINGEPETVKLPLRLLVLGDFSHNTSVDRLQKDENGAVVGEVDLEARRMRSITGNNLNSVMKDMGITLNLDGVRNWVRPKDGDLTVKLPITGMKSFDPDEIVNHEPNLKTLLLFRKLLEEMQSNIDNRKGVRKAVQRVFENLSNEEFLKAIQGTSDTFNGLKLPSDTDTSTPVPGAAEAKEAAAKATAAKTAFEEAAKTPTDGTMVKAAKDAAEAFKTAAEAVTGAAFTEAKTKATAAKTAADTATGGTDAGKFTAAATAFGDAAAAFSSAATPSGRATPGNVVTPVPGAAEATAAAAKATAAKTAFEEAAKTPTDGTKVKAAKDAAEAFKTAAEAVTGAAFTEAKTKATAAKTAADTATGGADAGKFTAAATAFEEAATAFSSAATPSGGATPGNVVNDAAAAAAAAAAAFGDVSTEDKKAEAWAKAAAFDKAAAIAVDAADAVTKIAAVEEAKVAAQAARTAVEAARGKAADAGKINVAKAALDTAKAKFTAAVTPYATAVQQESAKALSEIFSNSALDLPKQTDRQPLITTTFKENDPKTVTVLDPKLDPKLAEANRLLSGLSALFLNVKPVVEVVEERTNGTVTWKRNSRFEKGRVAKVIEEVDELLNLQMNEILHHKNFQRMESTWRGLDDLVQNTNFKADITIDILDVEKAELAQDFENNSSDIFSGALFEKVYIHEYDQYGGRPYGTMIGLYTFDSTPKDLDWLQRMGKLANAAHCPFITAADPRFFKVDTAQEVEVIKDLDGHLDHPKFSKWNKLRDTEEGAYIGLTFPRYILRLPWHPEKNPCTVLTNFEEDTRQGTKEDIKFDTADAEAIVAIDQEGISTADDPRKKPIKDTRAVDQSKYLWGNSAILFARNLTKAFEIAGWCQAIRGPKGGGLITGLPVDTFPLRGQEEIMPPVEIAIPDYREYEFARNGFIPLVYRKSSGDACFFSTQAIKLSKKFKDPKDSENSQLVTNLAYTFSITRLAHYIKCIMRDNIGSTADDVYIQQQIESWLAGYVTTVANPDDLTVRRFPFKATTVEVLSKPGEIGWYDCKVAVLPHIQFEGLNVTLMLESRLGSAK